MIQLYQDIMNVKNVNSTYFQARFQFSNTKPKPPTLLEQGCRYVFRPCERVLSCSIRGCAALGVLPSIIKRIKNIKNSIKQPS